MGVFILQLLSLALFFSYLHLFSKLQKNIKLRLVLEVEIDSMAIFRFQSVYSLLPWSSDDTAMTMILLTAVLRNEPWIYVPVSDYIPRRCRVFGE